MFYSIPPECILIVGGRLASTWSAVFGEVFRAPIASLMAEFWIVSSLLMFVMLAEATAVMPYRSLGLMYAV